MGLFRRSKTNDSALSVTGSVSWEEDAWTVEFPDGHRIVGVASLVDACALAEGPLSTTAAPKYDPPAKGTRSDFMPDGATDEVQMDSGRWLRAGMEFSVRGEPGRFIARWVKNGEVTAFGGREGHGAWRTFRLEDVRRVHTKTKLRSNQAMHTHAHQSLDTTVISHCPFCGSGDVIARSDGNVECVFCVRHFTVREQPIHSAMPGPAAPGAAPNPAAPGAPAAAPDLAAAPAFIPPGPDPASVGAPPFVPPKDTSVTARLKRPRLAARTLRTTQGHLVDEDAYIAHLAIRHGDREAVLAHLRGQ